MTAEGDAAETPGWQVVEDALVVPAPRDWNREAVFGGVFDPDGAPVPASFLHRSYTQVVFPPEAAPEAAETVAAPHLYGGFFINHFGHFLLEGTARLWAAPRFPDLPVAWASPPGPKPWQADLCNRLGIGGRMRFLERPTRFRRLLIPNPGYRVRDCFHPVHARFLACHPTPEGGGGGAPLWLSRTALGDRRGRIEGEAALEAALAAAGWRIAQPERLPLGEQLDALAGAGAVAGVEGSALHAVALLRRPPPLMLVVRRLHSENFRLIAEARGITQIDLIGALSHGHRRHALGAHAFIAPEAAAAALEAARREHVALGPAAPGPLERARLLRHLPEGRAFAPDAPGLPPPGAYAAALARIAAREVRRRLRGR